MPQCGLKTSCYCNLPSSTLNIKAVCYLRTQITPKLLSGYVVTTSELPKLLRTYCRAAMASVQPVASRKWSFTFVTVRFFHNMILFLTEQNVLQILCPKQLVEANIACQRNVIQCLYLQRLPLLSEQLIHLYLPYL
jgi:hypothetical protein